MRNYLLDIAEKYPNVYLGLNEKLIRIIKSAYRDIKNSIGAKDFRRLVNLKKANVSSIVSGDQCPSLKFIDAISKCVNWNFWDLIYEHAEYLRCKTNRTKIKIPKYLTTDLAYLLGALRDGSMTHYTNVYEIEISQKFKDWLVNSIAPRLERLFGIQTQIKVLKRKPNNAFAIRLRSVALYTILKILSGYERYNFLTPRIILDANFDLKRYYIAGYYDAEGRKNKSNIQFYQNWNDNSGCPSLIDIKNFLLSRGIRTSLTYHKQENYEAYIYVLYVKSESRSKFLEEIPLEHPRMFE